MNEPWVRDAIEKGSITINDITYKIKKNEGGSCDNCAFVQHSNCHRKAVSICTTGGNILTID